MPWKAWIAALKAAVVLGFVIALLGGAPWVAAAQTPSLNWGSEVNPSRCPIDAGGYRYLEINVTRHVEGDKALTNALAMLPPLGTGVAWADRDFNQHIQVWKIGISTGGGGGGGERFCALVRYQGSFTTLGGSSPQGTDGNIAPGIDGTFEGGYRLVFNADEGTNPMFSTRGQIGTFTGSIDLFDWLDPITFGYFVNVDMDLRNPLDLQWWGWIYHGGKNGTWVNAITGNQGDITD